MGEKPQRPDGDGGEVVVRYCEPIFRFCLARIGRTELAEDLSQEILTEVLEGLRRHSVNNLDAWIWTIARNRFRRLFLRPNPAKDVVTLNFGNEPISSEIGIEDKLILEEDKERAFRAILGIAEKYRQVLVAYYVHGESYELIARRLSMPLTSVKWRIHEGRKRLRERWENLMGEDTRFYDRIEMVIANNGSMDPNRYLNRQIARAIALAAYEKPVSIEEISRTTGIPALYIEDEIEPLIFGEALQGVGAKYATNFIILKLIDYRKMIQGFHPLADDIASLVLEGIRDREAAIRAIGFRGSEEPLEGILWTFVPRVMRTAMSRASRDVPELYWGDFLKRKDGGYGWFVVSEGTMNDYPDASGQNSYKLYDGRVQFHYYWIMRYFRNRINEVLHAIASHTRRDFLHEDGTVDAAQNEGLAAEMIECGLAERRGETVSLAIPLLTGKQNRELTALLDAVADSVTPRLTALVRDIYAAFLAFTPQRLQEQIPGVIGSYLNSAVGMVVGRLEARDVMRRPATDAINAKSVMVEVERDA
jgi:RNA polymerase sigma factor (sigma-70 family)